MHSLRHAIWSALGLSGTYKTTSKEYWSSCLSVSELASTSVASVGVAIGELCEAMGLCASSSEVAVDQRLASLWFGQSLEPLGWQLAPLWDPIAGLYQAKDNWIRLHTNLPHHRAVVLKVLGVEAKRERVEDAVKHWHAEALESAIVEAGGVAACLRSRSEWDAHPQGSAVVNEPLVHWTAQRQYQPKSWQPSIARPLNGLKVLDHTRVLAGPVATRTLAGFGASILRLDPPDWCEDNIVPDITLGKRCAFIDLSKPEQRTSFENLLTEADVLVHGYRSDALSGLGYGLQQRQLLNPGLIEVTLNAYGWTGPWTKRRGFDSLVQMSCGIADLGRQWANVDKPTPLPVQALDHATGYLMAAAVISALTKSVRGEGSINARLSLARTAELLCAFPQSETGEMLAAQESDFSVELENTSWGKARRLTPPLTLGGVPLSWDSPACRLGSSTPKWNP